MDLTINGVKNAKRKFHSQFDATRRQRPQDVGGQVGWAIRTSCQRTLLRSGPRGERLPNQDPHSPRIQTPVWVSQILPLACNSGEGKNETYGAQVVAYPKINKHAATIISFPIPGLSSGSRAVPAAAKTKSQNACQRPPTISGRRRPNWI